VLIGSRLSNELNLWNPIAAVFCFYKARVGGPNSVRSNAHMEGKERAATRNLGNEVRLLRQLV